MEQARMLEALDTELLYREIGRLADDDNGSSSSDDEMFVPSSGLLESMENIGTSRQWLKDLLLELSSDSDSEENIDFDLYLHQSCQMHRNQLKDDSSLSRFMYYSSDLVTGDNKWASSCEAVVKKEQMKKQDQRKSRKIKSLKSATGAQTDGEKYDRRKVGVPTFTDQSSATESISDTYPGHFSVHKKNKARSFDANAMRKKLWKIITKKDIPKAYRQRYQNRSTKLALLKKAAKDSVKKVRSKALESRQRSKREAIVSGARRMTREAQLFWKKYSKVEKTQRRKAEKQALVQRKLDDEIREAHRQRRKLNFLITQTELYAHFMNGKLKAEKIKGEMDEEEHRILQQLDQDREQSSVFKIFGETEDDFSKENVLSNAHSAYLQHQTKMDMFSPGACQDTVDYSSLPQPEMLNGKLTGYQLEGVNWLLGLYMHGLNGILADDMGLGKTVQTIAFFAHLAERVKIWGPFLVVAPASTLNNWHQELSRFLPSFKVLPYWGNINERKILRMFWNQKADVMHDSSAPFHVLVTSYQLVVSDVRYFQRIQWQYMVLDEAHALKSSSSVRWKTLLDFNCRNRLLLTGTPIQNTMAELWALLHFIMPTLFDSHGEFNEWFSKDIEFHAENKSNIDEKHLSRLHMILKPFMLRRLKSEVEHELTDKIEIRVLCQLAPRQRALYDALQKNITMEDLLQSHSVSSSSSNNSNVLMNLVMQFRKMCNHPDLFQSHDVYSSLHFCLPTHLLPKLIYHSFLNRPFCQGRSSKLYSDYCIHSRNSTHKSILNDEAFSFLPLIGMTANEYWNLFTEKDNSRKEYTRSLNAQLQRAVLSQVWTKPSLHDGTFQRHRLMAHQVDHASDVIDTRTVTSIIIPNIHDTLAYTTSTSNCLSNLFFWHSSSHFYSHLRCSVTYLKCPDAPHATATPKPPTDSTDKTINLETQSLDEMFQRRLVTSHLQCHPTSMPKLFRNIYIPKVYSTFPLFYCNDRHAEHKKQTSRRDDKTQNYLHFSPITIPDRERLVSDSGKLQAIDMLLKRLKEGQHRVLIYSQMTKMIDILEEYMMMRRHKYVRLDGSSRISSRRDTVAGFQSSDDIFVFLLSTRAGGLGINLTAADTVIFYDSDWNPTVDQQAMDRAHRLGQTKQVTVYRLVCQGTVDERILERAQEKRTIQHMVISGGNFKTDALKPKEVFSLLLDDQEMARMVSQRGQQEKVSLGGRRGKKRGRKSNREKELERVKRVKELENLAESAANNSTIRHGMTSRMLTSSRYDVTSSCQSSEASPSSSRIIESNPPSPTSDISRSDEKKFAEDETLVVVDEANPSFPPVTAATPPMRGRRGRGRPRIRPITSTRSQDSTSVRRPRGRSSGGRRRGRGVFTGRVAAMAGARAGAAAASAAAMAVYGYNYPTQK